MKFDKRNVAWWMAWVHIARETWEAMNPFDWEGDEWFDFLLVLLYTLIAQPHICSRWYEMGTLEAAFYVFTGVMAFLYFGHTVIRYHDRRRRFGYRKAK